MELRPVLPARADELRSPDLSAAALRQLFASSGHEPRLRGDFVGDPRFANPEGLREAAVLVPLVMHADGPSILLTERTQHLAQHAGQISFPGGRMEPGDADAIAGALRETQEEIGIEPAEVEVIGTLDRYVIRSGYAVTPVVGLLQPPVMPKPDPYEVAAAFEVPLAFFLDPANRGTGSREFQGVVRHFTVFAYPGRTIWGATAGMLVNLVERLAG